MNTKQFKKLLITLIGIFAIALSAILILNIINKPDIKNIQFSNIDKIKNNSLDSSEVEVSDIKQTDFSYTIIGYRYGEESSSIIVKKGSKDAKRRKSFCARSAGQMKQFPKAAKDPNSRLRQARKRWKC